MLKRGAWSRTARGFVWAIRIGARLTGSVARMCLSAAALGGAIAAVSIAGAGVTEQGGGRLPVLKAAMAPEPAPGGALYEARSAWVGSLKGKGSVRLRCVESQEADEGSEKAE